MREGTRLRWARIRPRVPRCLLRTAAVCCRVAGIEQRYLHWLIPASPADGLATLSPETPPALYRSLRRIARTGPVGDYYEFGLYNGFTFWFAQQSADLCGLRSMRFFGFDSFQGLPEPQGPDAEARVFKKGDYSCSQSEVVNRLSRFGLDWTRAHLEAGFYDQSLRSDVARREKMGLVALALIDCDLYQSTVPVLRFLEPLLQHGSLLLFDDWDCFGESDDYGQRRAFREFLALHQHWVGSEYCRFGWHGRGFVMLRRTAA
jgi:O-methyltransferase